MTPEGPAPLGPAVDVFVSASRSRPGTAHLTVRLLTGLWLCSCPGARGGRTCRHIREASALQTTPERTAP